MVGVGVLFLHGSDDRPVAAALAVLGHVLGAFTTGLVCLRQLAGRWVRPRRPLGHHDQPWRHRSVAVSVGLPAQWLLGHGAGGPPQSQVLPTTHRSNFQVSRSLALVHKLITSPEAGNHKHAKNGTVVYTKLILETTPRATLLNS